MPIRFCKSGLDFNGQIQHLQSRGLIIQDQAYALQVLEHVSFYRLRGYYIHWYDRATKKFHPGITFEAIVQLHQFDMELSSLILDISSHIEIALRSYLANELALYIDTNGTLCGHAMGYLDFSFFDDPNQFMENSGSIVREIQRSNEVFIAHNKSICQDNVPVWAAVEIMSFGTLSKLFSSLDRNVKLSITRKYYRRGSYCQWVESWLHAITLIRNMCAHRSRLYNRMTVARPIVLFKDRSPGIKPETIYAAFLAMHYLTEYIPNCRWKDRLKVLFSRYANVIDIRLLGFPADWEQHL